MLSSTRFLRLPMLSGISARRLPLTDSFTKLPVPCQTHADEQDCNCADTAVNWHAGHGISIDMHLHMPLPHIAHRLLWVCKPAYVLHDHAHARAQTLDTRTTCGCVRADCFDNEERTQIADLIRYDGQPIARQVQVSHCSPGTGAVRKIFQAVASQ